MPRRKNRPAHSASAPDQKSVELRKTLFIQQFEKEAQGRLNELEAKMENMLATVDKVFEVELMKMPLSLQKTLIGDLNDEEFAAVSEVSVAIKNIFPEIHKPPKKVSSRKVKQSENLSIQNLPVQKSLSKPSKGERESPRLRALVGSASTGNLGRSSAMALKKTLKNSGQAGTKPKLRSVSSAGDLYCAPHVTITTSRGQLFCVSEETKDEINLDMLDDVALCQIQRLKTLMDYLSSKAVVKN